MISIGTPKLTADVIQKATGSTLQKAQEYLPYLSSAMSRNGITTAPRVLAFLAQIGHESGYLNYTEEIASGSAYEGRSDLGNTQAGDGVRYKGRGLIGITGRSNYAWMSNALGQDFVNHPELISQPKWATETAAYFWHHHPKGDLSLIADTMDVKKPLGDPQNENAFKLITQRINGGQNGAASRSNNWIAGQSEIIDWSKKNPGKTILIATGIFALVALTLFLLLKNEKKIESAIAGN